MCGSRPGPGVATSRARRLTGRRRRAGRGRASGRAEREGVGRSPHPPGCQRDTAQPRRAFDLGADGRAAYTAELIRNLANKFDPLRAARPGRSRPSPSHGRVCHEWRHIPRRSEQRGRVAGTSRSATTTVGICATAAIRAVAFCVTISLSPRGLGPQHENTKLKNFRRHRRERESVPDDRPSVSALRGHVTRRSPAFPLRPGRRRRREPGSRDSADFSIFLPNRLSGRSEKAPAKSARSEKSSRPTRPGADESKGLRPVGSRHARTSP